MSKRIDPLDVSLAIENGELSINVDNDGYIYLIDNYNNEEFIIGVSSKETEMRIDNVHVDEYYCPNCGAENNTM